MNNQAPDDSLLALIKEEYANDPALLIINQPNKQTAPPFTPPAPPSATATNKEVDTTTTAPPASNLGPAGEDDKPKKESGLTVTEDAAIDWSERADDIIAVSDLIYTNVFAFIAKADSEERQVFQFSETDKENLSRFMKPSAQKHNWKVGPEVGLCIVFADITARNFDAALEMRKLKMKLKQEQEAKEAAQVQLAQVKAKQEAEDIKPDQVGKSEAQRKAFIAKAAANKKIKEAEEALAKAKAEAEAAQTEDSE